MNQRLALTLSAVLTTFLLVVSGGVIVRVSQSDATPAAAAPAASAATPTAVPATPVPTPDLNAQVEALIQQREAAYRDLIKQANDQLQAAYQQQAATARAAAAPRTTTVANPTAAQPAAPAVAVSVEGAASVAANVAFNNQPMVKTPELVLFSGHVAYEVVFKHGSIYVDANSGQVLFNGTVNRGGGSQQTASAPPASGGEHDDHGGHDD